MKSRPLVTSLAVATLAAAVYAGAKPIGPLPPLGSLVDPVHGVWGSAAAGDLPLSASAKIPHLSGKVDVRYDERGVPHIFATTEEDAYRALGYVVARDRLFQLDIQTRAASGRLTELVGARALPLDQRMRELGMPRAAERKLAALDPTSVSRRLIDAYSDGVNAYIDALEPADYPIEYKLLNARPERWQPVNTLHLLNRMGWTLASANPERTFARAAALVGSAAAAALFPLHTPIQEPIQPVPGWTGPHNIFAAIPPPGAPDSGAVALAALFEHVQFGDNSDTESRRSFASNNWAVAPRRTKNGYALLAGDPHLNLTLPSIWYETHIVVPGKLDVYGVTIPGAPGMIIGFNRDIAWTFTNTGADVMDFYSETVDDDAHPTKYMLDGAWHALVLRTEVYRDQNGKTILSDTMAYTHRGPLMREGGRWLSMRWTVLEPSEEMRGLYGASHARTTHEFQDAMAQSFFTPAQNLLVADRAGSIAIRSTGHFPIRPGDGSGRVIRDGTTSASDWTGFWPVDRYPQSFDPAQGFLASANQEPEAPESQLGYLGTDQDYEVWRALRINQLLRADSAVTPDAMRRWQTDPGSVRADMLVPYFMAAARAQAARGRGSDDLTRAASLLGQWDRRYTRDNERAVLFESAVRRLVLNTWDELSSGTDSMKLVATPTSPVLAELLTQPTSAWWDDRRTRDVVEDRDDIVARSLVQAYNDVTRKYGPAESGGWRWDRVRFINIHHLLQIPAFSALNIPAMGGVGTLSPSSGDGTDGPSWRMVVELGPDVHAWATLPGGESGNPMSKRYTDHLHLWKEGQLEPLVFPRAAGEMQPPSVAASLTLTPEH